MPLLTVKQIKAAMYSNNLIYFKKETIILTHDRTDVPTITNTPLHPKSFKLMVEDTEIEQITKRVHAGQHMHWIVVKFEQRGRRIIQREILA